MQPKCWHMFIKIDDGNAYSCLAFYEASKELSQQIPICFCIPPTFVGEPNILTAAQLRELDADPMVEIVAHGSSLGHLMTGLTGAPDNFAEGYADYATMVCALRDGKAMLEDILGHAVEGYAPPQNYGSNIGWLAVTEAGFRYGGYPNTGGGYGGWNSSSYAGFHPHPKPPHVMLNCRLLKVTNLTGETIYSDWKTHVESNTDNLACGGLQFHFVQPGDDYVNDYNIPIATWKAIMQEYIDRGVNFVTWRDFYRIMSGVTPDFRDSLNENILFNGDMSVTDLIDNPTKPSTATWTVSTSPVFNLTGGARGGGSIQVNTGNSGKIVWGKNIIALPPGKYKVRFKVKKGTSTKPLRTLTNIGNGAGRWTVERYTSVEVANMGDGSEWVQVEFQEDVIATSNARWFGFHVYILNYDTGYHEVSDFELIRTAKCRYRSAKLCISSDGPDFRQPEDTLTIRIYDVARQQAINAVFPIYDFLTGAPHDNLQMIVNAIAPDMSMMGFDLILPQDSACLQIEQSEGSANLLISITCNNPLLWTEIKLYE